MPVKMIYPDNKQAYVVALLAVMTAGCGINPNFQTIFKPDAESYSVEGAITRGFATRPKVGYVQSEGDNPDLGSVKIIGPADAGVNDQSGIYVPSVLVPVNTDGRFKITFTGRPRYVFIRLFAWDDLNNNGLRDTNESLSQVWSITKKDTLGWQYNAPEWNQFNFSFTR
ncbi:MAG: hypothetical protein JWM80_3594 [Cyanobacteria bacterium RYN_339]|nr:hypothetical protein [Cyanobacteria bacterium RYN_339]